MSVGYAHLTDGNAESSSGSISSQATASVTPTASRVYVIDVFSIAATVGNAAAPTGVAGAGLTFALEKDVSDTASGASLSRWRATGTPSTGAVTITYGAGRIANNWSFGELTGADTGGTNGASCFVQSVSNSDNATTHATITATLAAFGSASNGALAAFGAYNVAPIKTATPDTGWTEEAENSIITQSGATYTAIETQFRVDNDTTAVVTWSGNTGMYAIASELKVAPAGGSGGSFLIGTKRMNGGMNDMARGM